MRKMTVAFLHLILSLVIAVLTVEGCISLWYGYGLNDVVCFVVGLGGLMASTLCCYVLLQIILEYNPETTEITCMYCGSNNVGWYPDINELQCNVCYVTM